MELGTAKQKIVDYCVANNISVQQLKDANTALMATMLEVNNINPHSCSRYARHSVPLLQKAQAVACKDFLHNEMFGSKRVAVGDKYPVLEEAACVDEFGDIQVVHYPHGRPGREAHLDRVAAAEAQK